MRKLFIILLLLFPFQVFAGGDEIILDWDKANRNVTRLSPEIFDILPKNIQKYLKSNNYLIPQIYAEKKSHNVISGQFIKEGQKDWAVLASKNYSSSILIFQNGNTDKQSIIEILPAEDKSYLQTVGEGEFDIGFSRGISSVNKDELKKMNEEDGGMKNPPTISHDGIANDFYDKGGVTYYYYNGNWLRWFVSD